MTDTQPRPDDEDDETQEIDMSGVFETDRLITDLSMGQVPPDERLAAVLAAWRKEVHDLPISDELGDPAVDMWREAVERAVERAKQPASIMTVVIEFVAGLLLIIKAVGHLVRLAIAALVRLVAQLPWKHPRPWGE